MRARLSIIAGLVAGIAVAVLVLGGLLALTPDPTAPSTHAPASSPTAIPSAVVSAAPSASVAPGASLAPIAPSPGGSPSVPAPAAFHVGQPAPALTAPKVGGGMFWIDAAGIVRDGALGGIGPDVMAAGSKTILPGVDVTP